MDTSHLFEFSTNCGTKAYNPELHMIHYGVEPGMRVIANPFVPLWNKQSWNIVRCSSMEAAERA